MHADNLGEQLALDTEEGLKKMPLPWIRLRHKMELRVNHGVCRTKHLFASQHNTKINTINKLLGRLCGIPLQVFAHWNKSQDAKGG